MLKPTLVFVPGIWAGGQVYDKTVAILRKRGYECYVVELASPGHAYSRERTPPGPTVREDIEIIRKKLTEIVESNGGTYVILVMHAGGGIIGSIALQGLTRLSRKRLGKRGGVTKLAFVAALLYYQGYDWPHFEFSVSELLVSSIAEKGLMWRLQQPDGALLECKNPRMLMFNDVDDDALAAQLCDRLVPQTGHGYEADLQKGEHGEYYGWMDDGIQSTYLISKRDNIVMRKLQETLAMEAGCAYVEECDAGHMAPETAPEDVARFIMMTAGDEDVT